MALAYDLLGLRIQRYLLLYDLGLYRILEFLHPFSALLSYSSCSNRYHYDDYLCIACINHYFGAVHSSIIPQIHRYMAEGMLLLALILKLKLTLFLAFYQIHLTHLYVPFSALIDLANGMLLLHQNYILIRIPIHNVLPNLEPYSSIDGSIVLTCTTMH